MAQTHKGISPSFPVTEHANIADRVRELRLPERGGLSRYFQMLRELDVKFKLRVYHHEADNQLHFYPENAAALAEGDEAGELLIQLLRKAEKKASAPDDPTYPEGKRKRAARP